MGRLVLAMAAGYLVFGLSAVLLFQVAGRDPHRMGTPGFMVFAVVYGVLFAIVAGYVAARIAREHRMLPPLGVAIIIAGGALVSLATRPGAGAIWTQLAAALLMAPAVLVGGWLRARQVGAGN